MSSVKSQSVLSDSTIVDNAFRLSDIQMMTMCNSRERTAAEFEEMFKAADPRFHLVKIHRTPGSSLSILEIRFNTG